MRVFVAGLMKWSRLFESTKSSHLTNPFNDPFQFFRHLLGDVPQLLAFDYLEGGKGSDSCNIRLFVVSFIDDDVAG